MLTNHIAHMQLLEDLVLGRFKKVMKSIQNFDLLPGQHLLLTCCGGGGGVQASRDPVSCFSGKPTWT